MKACLVCGRKYSGATRCPACALPLWRIRQARPWYERTSVVCGLGFLLLPLLLAFTVAASGPGSPSLAPSAQAYSSQPSSNASSWQELGPYYVRDANVRNPSTRAKLPVSGRVNALAVDPSTCAGVECRTVYVGAATGGVWKTTNAGGSWKPLTDGQPGLAVGTIVLDPRNPRIVYVGTGDPNHAEGSQAGSGILRSADGGRTWVHLGRRQFENRAVSSIVVDPRTAGTVKATIYAMSTRAYSGGAASGGSSTWNSPRLPSLGFSISSDGGRTWVQSNPSLAFGEDATGGLEGQSLVMDRRDPNVLYAAFDFAGVFRSRDDGRTWSPLTRGLPQTAFSIVKLAMAPGNPRILYAAFDMSTQHGGPVALYRTADGGSHWSELRNTPNFCGTQCQDNLVLAVDPRDASTVYAGGTANYDYLFEKHTACRKLGALSRACSATVVRSVDGGMTWADVAENGSNGPLHPDIHALLIDPHNRFVVYVGTDGGLFHTSDAGRSWNDLNQGLATFQVQGLAVSSTGDIFAGTQDNGTLRLDAAGRWTQVWDGDGGFTAVDPSNPNTVYLSQDGASLYRNDRSGGASHNTFIAPFWGDFDKQRRGQSYEPFSLAPSQPDDVFYGTFRIWRSQLRGGVDGNGGGDATNDKSDTIDWVPISFDLSCATHPRQASATCNSPTNQGQGISAIAVSPLDPDTVIAASANGHLWLARDALAPVRTDRTCDPRVNPNDVATCNFTGGVRWSRIDRGLPRRFPSSVLFGPGLRSTLYVTFSGFDENTPGASGHVFMSTDLGATWTDVSARLPDEPVSAFLVNPFNRHLYVAFGPQVFMSPDDGKTWRRMDAGLPGASIYQMQLDMAHHMLVVGTYGRGVWRRAAP